MATITMTFDTVSKDLSVAIDGKDVPDVDNVSIYKRTWDGDGDGDDYRCNICTVTKDDEQGTQTVVQVMASDTTEAKQATASTDFQGFSVKASVTDNKQISRLAGLLGA